MDKIILKNNYSSLYKNYNSLLDNSYLKARKYIGFCNNTNLSIIMLYGSKTEYFLNSIMKTKINNKQNIGKYTILFMKNKVITELLILKLSPLRYIIISENEKKVLNILNKSKRKFPLITATNVTNKYSIFTFHGNKSNDFFNNINSQNLFKIQHQNYQYYLQLVSKNNESITTDYYKSLDFIPISIETKTIFLYNNSVITNIEKIPRKYKKRVCDHLYGCENSPKKKELFIKQFELQENFPVFKGSYIYNEKRKKSGIVHCSYYIPNKKYPYIICFVWKNLSSKTAILKYNKQKVFLKQFIKYEV